MIIAGFFLRPVRLCPAPCFFRIGSPRGSTNDNRLGRNRSRFYPAAVDSRPSEEVLATHQASQLLLFFPLISRRRLGTELTSWKTSPVRPRICVVGSRPSTAHVSLGRKKKSSGGVCGYLSTPCVYIAVSQGYGTFLV